MHATLVGLPRSLNLRSCSRTHVAAFVAGYRVFAEDRAVALAFAMPMIMTLHETVNMYSIS